MPTNAEVEILSPVADSYVETMASYRYGELEAPGRQDENNGDYDVLKVSAEDSDIFVSATITYLKFDLTQVDKEIGTATLRLYSLWTVDKTIIGTYRCVDNSWSESGITYNNAPNVSGGASDIITVDYVDENEWHEWDVTSIVKEGEIVTIVLMVPENEVGDYQVSHFASKERTNGPQLSLDFSAKAKDSEENGMCLGTIGIVAIPIIAAISVVAIKKRRK